MTLEQKIATWSIPLAKSTAPVRDSSLISHLRSRKVNRSKLVTFMDYDLGYFDDETCRLEPIESRSMPVAAIARSSVRQPQDAIVGDYVVDYCEGRVKKNGPDTPELFRLFRAPGMPHSRGRVRRVRHDAVSAIIDRVEAQKALDTGVVCTGQGSIDDAAYFSCVAPG